MTHRTAQSERFQGSMGSTSVEYPFVTADSSFQIRRYIYIYIYTRFILRASRTRHLWIKRIKLSITVLEIFLLSPRLNKFNRLNPIIAKFHNSIPSVLYFITRVKNWLYFHSIFFDVSKIFDSQQTEYGCKFRVRESNAAGTHTLLLLVYLSAYKHVHPLVRPQLFSRLKVETRFLVSGPARKISFPDYASPTCNAYTARIKAYTQREAHCFVSAWTAC